MSGSLLVRPLVDGTGIEPGNEIVSMSPEIHTGDDSKVVNIRVILGDVLQEFFRSPQRVDMVVHTGVVCVEHLGQPKESC